MATSLGAVTGALAEAFGFNFYLFIGTLVIAFPLGW